jgi:hypothetical protein
MCKFLAVKRVLGWLAAMGLPIALLTSFPISNAMIQYSDQQLLWITGSWLAVSWISLIALVAWVLCWLVSVVLLLLRRRAAR